MAQFHTPAHTTRNRLWPLLVLMCTVFGIAMWFTLQGIAQLPGVYSTQNAGNEQSAHQDSEPWNLVLVNDSHPLPQSFSIDTTEMPGGERVDTRIAEPLSELFDACKEAGYSPFVRSGFRTRAEQEAILESRIKDYEAEGMDAKDARQAALDWVAEPGTSEHELGLAVDINDKNNDQNMYDWLAEHAHEYGFIQRYPSEKSSVTGISHEPWHYRYVGVEAATAMWKQGITLEEYLEEQG